MSTEPPRTCCSRIDSRRSAGRRLPLPPAECLSLSFVCVDQPAWTKPRHDFRQAGIGDGEATLASTEHTGAADHFLIHVPGAMHHDRAGKSVAVGGVQSLEPHRVTMGTHIQRVRFIGSGRSRIRAGLVGETLEPSRMRRVGTPAMGNQMRLHAAVREIHQVKPRCARGKGEIGDADKIPVADAGVMLLQSGERAPQQTGGDLAAVAFCSSKSKPSSSRPTSKAGKRKIDKKAARKYQDIDLRRNYAHLLT